MLAIKIRSKSNISIIGAIGTNNFLAYQIVLGNINSQVYNSHLISLIINLRAHYNDNNFILILDNYRNHKSKIVMNTLGSVQHKFLPTYTPQLNAIEKLWQSLKITINKQGMMLQSRIYITIHQFFNRLDEKQLNSYIYSTIPFLEKSLLRIEY